MIATASAQNRFPRPDFESGYQYPEVTYAIPNESLWATVDIILLVVLMGIVAWTVHRKRTRKPIIWVSVISIAYFGFFREGCVCSIGSIQNVALSLADSSYILPVTVLLIFLLPIIFAFFFGRVFCGGVCPFGALQELVNVKNFRLSKAVSVTLSLIPWIYLFFAIMYAVTGSSFIICNYDPFVGIFRLGGDMGLIIFGILLLISSIFTGRTFCRFICPYGALLSLFSRVSIWKIKLTPKQCNNCELCHNACPVDAIKPPYENRTKESRMQGTKRVLSYFVIFPVAIVAGALLLSSVSGELSRANKDVRLYDMVMKHETEPENTLSPELEAFYGLGDTVENLTDRYSVIQEDFKLYSGITGGLIGLVVGMTLISLSVKRTRKEYEIDNAACVSCARCFSYCPQNIKKENMKPRVDKLHTADK